MSKSQNGYKSRDSSLIASYTIPKTNGVKIALRKGDVSVVALHYLSWHHVNIEPIRQKDTGGYNPRVIEGTNVDSNHASGTAWDINWGDHPMGKANTYTAAQQKKIRAQLKFYEGAIRWGGDYKGRKDDMHGEINKNAEFVARIAKKCKAQNVTVPKPPTKPSAPMKPPSKEYLTVDGKLGPKTISLWQKIMGTTVDGVIDKKDSELIRAVQTKLTRVDHRLKVDGDFGPKTIRALQRYLKAPVDGFLSKPVSKTVKALQRRLNTGKF